MTLAQRQEDVLKSFLIMRRMKRVRSVLCIGSVAGAVKGGITCYNSVVRNYSYSDAVATTTLGTLIGFGQGFATVCLSPIIIPIAMMIAVTRYIEQDKNVI